MRKFRTFKPLGAKLRLFTAKHFNSLPTVRKTRMADLSTSNPKRPGSDADRVEGGCVERERAGVLATLPAPIANCTAHTTAEHIKQSLCVANGNVRSLYRNDAGALAGEPMHDLHHRRSLTGQLGTPGWIDWAFRSDQTRQPDSEPPLVSARTRMKPTQTKPSVPVPPAVAKGRQRRDGR